MLNVKVIELTPELAEKLLKNNTDNRILRPRLVVQYAEDMKAGRWHENGEPIIVDPKGKLISGQHRCHAVIRSGVTLKNIVMIETNDPKMIDTGATRSVRDLSGIGNYEASTISACLMMTSEYKGKYISKALIIDKYGEWENSVKYVCGRLNGKLGIRGLRKSAVSGAILSAHLNGYPEDLIDRFCYVFTSGEMECPEEKVIILLRNIALASAYYAGGTSRAELFLKTQAALKVFEEHRVVTKLYALSEPYYKIELARSANI